jgi:hypothetical protein
MRSCAACVGLHYGDMSPETALSARHCQLLSSYLANMQRGAPAVRDLMVNDVLRFQELGAAKYADDLLVVLRCFLSEFAGAEAKPLTCEWEQKTGLTRRPAAGPRYGEQISK